MLIIYSIYHHCVNLALFGAPKGGIHKSRGQLKGERESQITTFLYKPYLVKVTKIGVENAQKPDHT